MSKHKHRSSKYIQLEAESSEEEINSDYNSEDMDGVLENSKVMPNYNLPLKDRYAEKLKDLEEKYLYMDNKDDSEEDIDVNEISTAHRQAFPKMSDPLLFLVRVKIGKEKSIASKIAEHAKTIPDITAILQKDGLKGYIYIESFKKSAVDEAVSKVKNVYKNRIAAVPIAEMVDVLNSKKEYMINEYGRVKNGKYKGDLAQILENYEDSCQIRIVPRIDGKQCLFDPDKFQNKAIFRDGGYYYNRDFYKDGFLIKMVLKDSLDFNTEVSVEELKKFQNISPLKIGERAKVIRGDLKGFLGQIVSVNGNSYTITNGKKTFDIDTLDLKRDVQLGDTFSYKGKNGIVLKINGNTVVLGIRNMEAEMKVSVDDLELPVSEKIEKPPVKVPFKKHINPLIGKSVKITHGEFKGLIGTVKEINRMSCRIRLGSNSEYVMVNRSAIKEIVKSNAKINSARDDIGLKTPGFKTPGYTTPGYKIPSNIYSDFTEKINSKEFTYDVMPKNITVQFVYNNSKESMHIDSRKNIVFKNNNIPLEELTPVIPTKRRQLIYIFKGIYNGTIGEYIDEQNGIAIIQNADDIIRTNVENLTIANKIYE